MLAVALAVALWSQPGDWFRRPWSNPYNPSISKSLEQPAIYLLIDKPLAYIGPAAAARVAYRRRGCEINHPRKLTIH
jgi:hypothetical protein